MALPRSSWRVAPLLLLLGLVTAGAPPQEAPISIRLTGAGIQVTPARATVAPGQAIVWASDLPFAVAVERNAALFGRTLPPQALRGRPGTPARAGVGAEAPAGTYKYSVAVWDGENVWVVDPEIVVRRP